MDRVIEQLTRLYFPTGTLPIGVPATLELCDEQNKVRALAIRFEKSDDWPRLSALYQALQGELGLPAQAVSVSAKGGFQLWLSLAQGIPLPQARAFLQGLRRKYLGDLAASAVTCYPAENTEARIDLAPAFDEKSQRWSAFIDPSLGSIFVDQLGLEIAPNMEGQADILAGFECISAKDFQNALDILQQTVQPEPAVSTQAPLESAAGVLAVDLGPHDNPRSFLLAVMNSPSAPLDQRIRAAAALLPYFESSATR